MIFFCILAVILAESTLLDPNLSSEQLLRLSLDAYGQKNFGMVVQIFKHENYDPYQEDIIDNAHYMRTGMVLQNYCKIPLDFTTQEVIFDIVEAVTLKYEVQYMEEDCLKLLKYAWKLADRNDALAIRFLTTHSVFPLALDSPRDYLISRYDKNVYSLLMDKEIPVSLQLIENLQILDVNWIKSLFQKAVSHPHGAVYIKDLFHLALKRNKVPWNTLKPILKRNDDLFFFVICTTVKYNANMLPWWRSLSVKNKQTVREGLRNNAVASVVDILRLQFEKPRGCLSCFGLSVQD